MSANKEQSQAVDNNKVALPSYGLPTCLTKATQIYNADGLHVITREVAAEHMGVKATNGPTGLLFSSLFTFGLLEKRGPGMVSASDNVELYRLAESDPAQQADILRRCLLSCRPYANLLERYPNGLPSDPMLKQIFVREFKVDITKSDSSIKQFKESVQIANYYSGVRSAPLPQASEREASVLHAAPNAAASAPQRKPAGFAQPNSALPSVPDGGDTIPVRLSGGRRAFIVLPGFFSAADKQRLLRQIEILECDEPPVRDAESGFLNTGLDLTDGTDLPPGIDANIELM